MPKRNKSEGIHHDDVTIKDHNQIKKRIFPFATHRLTYAIINARKLQGDLMGFDFKTKQRFRFVTLNDPLSSDQNMLQNLC